jgi:hypothetical protein
VVVHRFWRKKVFKQASVSVENMPNGNVHTHGQRAESVRLPFGMMVEEKYLKSKGHREIRDECPPGA